MASSRTLGISFRFRAIEFSAPNATVADKANVGPYALLLGYIFLWAERVRNLTIAAANGRDVEEEIIFTWSLAVAGAFVFVVNP